MQNRLKGGIVFVQQAVVLTVNDAARRYRLHIASCHICRCSGGGSGCRPVVRRGGGVQIVIDLDLVVIKTAPS
jgi:hypothetical protein